MGFGYRHPKFFILSPHHCLVPKTDKAWEMGALKGSELPLLMVDGGVATMNLVPGGDRGRGGQRGTHSVLKMKNTVSQNCLHFCDRRIFLHVVLAAVRGGHALPLLTHQAFFPTEIIMSEPN